jgi:hypothetical protein
MSVAREYKDIEARGSKQISLISDLDSEFAMELPPLFEGEDSPCCLHSSLPFNIARGKS